ncbi:MAG TPA: aminotransferase class I/II-fold pyridoxal phosphate-dependent enzyme [Clostridiales bacterium]|jgi:DNA-binding transcriptional MocR family regulator|nr:aminotransferase class I/II-fold pyridoxal phosphate-dependent enzyme [Clostridiales bacterium]
MKPYSTMKPAERETEYLSLKEQYRKFADKGLKLDMTRGKPGEDQLKLAMPMLDVLTSDSDCRDSAGMDCRNYGGLLGSADARKLFGDYLGISPEETIVVGSSSLSFMYDCVARAMLTGVLGSEKPWAVDEPVKFLCPVPGYDRHFTICEFLGIEMIPVELTEWGPDMDEVRRLVREDASIKGMWCVPKYTNPYGGCYSDDAVRQLASMETAAEDFRIFWDNAYNMHYVYRDVPLLNILDECRKAGHPNRPYLFGSTSKITFPGAGVGFFGASADNIAFTSRQISAQTISWDKMNMLRHVRFFKDIDGIRSVMDQQAALLRPKFDVVLNKLEQQLSGLGAGEWVRPDGGYFVTFLANPGCAKRLHELCRKAGVALTDPGATHPLHRDPEDRFLRIAPSYPPVEELSLAMDVFCVAARMAALEQLDSALS